MSTSPDEFDAVRTIVKTLETFGAEDQQRVLRWAAEKLGLAQPLSRGSVAVPGSSVDPAKQQLTEITSASGTTDIKSFVGLKKPKNDGQFAAVVAYYYRFEAPETERKQSINQDILLDACRKTNYPRPPAPGQTLRNAVNAGLLDKAGTGSFSINSVGENLVAVTLPGDTQAPVVAGPTRRRRKSKRSGTTTKIAIKKTPRKAK